MVATDGKSCSWMQKAADRVPLFYLPPNICEELKFKPIDKILHSILFFEKKKISNF